MMMINIITAKIAMLLLLTSSSRAFPPFKLRTLAIINNKNNNKMAQTLSSSIATAGSPSSSLADTSASYTKLLQRLQQITHLNQAKSVLSYDQLVFMPKAASTGRGAQMSALATLIHETTTAPELKEWLDQAMLDASDSDDMDAKRLLQLEHKSLAELERIPTTLAARVASLGASAYTSWVECKGRNDYAAFCPTLQECFDTSMEVATKKRGDKTYSLYTQMLDEFEMGMSQQRIDDIFGEIQAALVPLIAKVLSSDQQPSTSPLEGHFDLIAQKEFCQDIVTALGYNVDHGRIDVSVHPFTMAFSPQDVRITSRFRTDEWYQGLAAMIHEGGHAMYEQSLGASATNLDSALSMGTHESQSLFWERHVGLSKEFWDWATPKLKQKFPDNFSSRLSADEVYAAVNAVAPSLIRVEADELTYPLHVILRYNIEKSVIGGELDVKDIPARWNADMKSMLNVDVPNDAKGCMQDVHWSALAFGYFPTYLIGSATAAQLAYYCEKDLGMAAKVKNGEFSAIKTWLTDKVHRHGRRYDSLDALLLDQVGETLNPKYFIQYLTEKYSDLYQL